MDGGDIPVDLECDESKGGLKHFRQLMDCLQKTKARVNQSCRNGHTPMVIGGDHSIAIGAVAGALECHGDQLALLWIDAHSDLNNPASSPSGNLHGMPIGALMGIESGVVGLQDMHWRHLTNDIVPEARLKPSQTAWFGLRDLDDGERNRINAMPEAFVATMSDIDRYGVVSSLERFDRWLRKSGATKLWISLDVDSLDPILAPGTGTAVLGGLTYREMHMVGEVIWELLQRTYCPYEVVGLDLVEVNPVVDTNNVTAKTAVEWIGSLFGKSILGVRA
jgi:arginase